MKTRSPLTMALALLLTFAVFAPSAWAHRGPRHHRHGHRAAVIVVGKPRPVRAAVVINGMAHGVLDLNVKPKTTQVWIDGTLRGNVDRFDGYPSKLHLRPGLHEIKLVTPDGVEVARDIRVRAGIEVNIGLDLR